jgi:hypothetical protein
MQLLAQLEVANAKLSMSNALGTVQLIQGRTVNASELDKIQASGRTYVWACLCPVPLPASIFVRQGGMLPLHTHAHTPMA